MANLVVFEDSRYSLTHAFLRVSFHSLYLSKLEEQIQLCEFFFCWFQKTIFSSCWAPFFFFSILYWVWVVYVSSLSVCVVYVLVSSWTTYLHFTTYEKVWKLIQGFIFSPAAYRKWSTSTIKGIHLEHITLAHIFLHFVGNCRKFIKPCLLRIVKLWSIIQSSVFW